MTQEQLVEFWYYFLEEYYGYTGTEAEKFNDSIDIYNALDLLQRNYFQPGCLSDLITLILVRPKLKKYFRNNHESKNQNYNNILNKPVHPRC